MDQPVFVKLLRLVRPELAEWLRMDDWPEGPFFISPLVRIDPPILCWQCNRRYLPLMYACGQQTTSHAFHEGCGGLYCYVVPDLDGLDRLPKLEEAGFVAQVDPIGQISFRCTRDENCARVEAVWTRRITAYCLGKQPRSPHHGAAIPITEGILLENDSQFWPLCSPDELPRRRRPRLRFHIRPEGEVSFSPV